MHGLTDRRRAFVRQAHAFAHVCDGLPAQVKAAVCPYCLGLFGLEHLRSNAGDPPLVNIEHAPPQQASRLGTKRAMCLAHRDCQNTTFEARAGLHRRDVAALRAGGAGRLPGLIDGTPSLVKLVNDGTGVRPVDIPTGTEVRVFVTFPEPVILTELKAAYAVAFAALGYSWIAKPTLDRVRTAIATGDLSALGYQPLAVLDEAQPGTANTIVMGAGAIVVIGDNPRYAVVLPNDQPGHALQGPSLQLGGPGVPWLPDRWWRTTHPAPTLAFWLDSQATAPRFACTVETAATA